MALINCNKCGKQISDKADSCIHCGLPIDKIKQTNNIFGSIWISLIIILFMFILYAIIIYINY